MIVCDRDTGVHHLSHHGDYTNLLCSGHFSDICLVSDDKIYALDWKEGKIHTFVSNLNGWVEDTQFKLVQYRNCCSADILCTTSTHLYVSCRNIHCVLVYTLSGEYVYRAGGRGGEVGKFNYPYLSNVDSGGKLLVCDRRNHRLKVFDTQSRKWGKVTGLEEVKWPVCAGVGDKYLWVGTDYPHKLLKFEFA